MLEVEAQEKLRELGDTPYAVFRSLKAKSCKGEQNSNNTCPVARFLQREVVPEASEVKVLYSFATILTDAVDPPKAGRWTRVPVPEEWERYRRQIKEATATLILPEAVSEFVRLFDNGKYPSLVAS